MIFVTEAEIYRGIQTIYHEGWIVCEGGSAVSAAALLAGKFPAL